MSKQISGTFYLLLDLALFFEHYHNERMEQALDIIKHLKLLPTSLDTVEQKVNSFKYYENEVSVCSLFITMLMAVKQRLAEEKSINLILNNYQVKFPQKSKIF